MGQEERYGMDDVLCKVRHNEKKGNECRKEKEKKQKKVLDKWM